VDLPTHLEINAWTGTSTRSSVVDGLGVGDRADFRAGLFLPAAPISLTEWRHPSIGWGLVLPENTAIPADARATAVDAPPAIQRLLAARGGPVFRYDASWNLRNSHLRRYFPSGQHQEPLIVGSERGNLANQVPYYMLVYGAPARIPWAFQLALGTSCLVGRLDLEGDALESYIGALLTDWDGAASDPKKQTIWSVDHETGDITTLMRRILADRVLAKFKSETDYQTDWFEKPDATCSALYERLAEHKPGLVITTSHGVTAPLSPSGAMHAQLGNPVDVNEEVLDPAALLASWQPDGAIWYSHACCAAGADESTGFDGLVTAGSQVDRILKAVASGGAIVAPLPRSLLGAKKPLRAFVGHIEPTFDWTLREPSTNQSLTTSLIDALYHRLFTKSPISHAFERFHTEGLALLSLYDKAVAAAQRGEDPLGTALALRLMSRDHERLVILGDPTVALPL
jgi:hypothetical protein